MPDDVAAPPPAHGERPLPDLHAADERTMALAMLDWYRNGVMLKVAGLSDVQASTSVLPMGMTVSGLVKHLALVEDTWFSERVADEPIEPWASAPFDVEPDWEFRTGGEDGLSSVVTLYRAACARSRVVVASRHFDDVAVHERRGTPFTVRFAVLHLIEETARHLGHLDIMRELIDGTTGE